LKVHFGLEAFVVFLRAALDTAVGGYALYFSAKTDIDSINDVLKKWPPGWVPERSRVAWQGIKAAYDSETFTWIHSLTGRDKGMSLRDLAVHKGIVSIDTMIDEAHRGRFFYHSLTRNSTRKETWQGNGGACQYLVGDGVPSRSPIHFGVAGSDARRISCDHAGSQTDYAHDKTTAPFLFISHKVLL
jgi:hypothetical protein